MWHVFCRGTFGHLGYVLCICIGYWVNTYSIMKIPTCHLMCVCWSQTPRDGEPDGEQDSEGMLWGLGRTTLFWGWGQETRSVPCTVCTHHPYFTRDASWCRIPQICWLFGNVCKYCATNEILNHYLKIWTNIKIANQSSCIGCDMLDLESKMIWSYDLIRSLMF